MAITKKTYTEAQTSGTFETHTATIEMSPAMFELLSAGIYEDRIMAVIRELSCNARDSMKEHALNLGKTVGELSMMEIHSPTFFEPYFFVRDYGTGLTHEQVFDIYLSYGKSTKTGSNDFVGMFGIGSKSPLAYTDSFIVTSYIDGTMLQYNVYKDKGIPKITLLQKVETDEENGLKVLVSVEQKDNQPFTNRICDFFKLFNTNVSFTGIDSYEPIIFSEDNELYKLATNYSRICCAVMGGVPYTIPTKLSERLTDLISAPSIILPFNIGDLNVASSRENLSFTDGDATSVMLEERIACIEKVYLSNVQKDVDKCSNVREAFDKLYNCYQLSCSYWGKGYSLPTITINNRILEEVNSFYRKDKQVYRLLKGNSYYQSRVRDSYTTSSDDLRFSTNRRGEVSTNYVIFKNDKPTGGVKCARKYAIQNSVEIIFDPTDTQLLILKDLFGDLPVVSCTEIFDKYYPKKQRVVKDKVKVSGIFKVFVGKESILSGEGTVITPITTVDGTEEGYYLPMVRDSAILNEELTTLDTLLLAPEIIQDLMVLCKIKDVYLIRKTSAVKNRPKGLTLLTSEIISKKMVKLLNKSVIKRLAKDELKESLQKLPYMNSASLFYKLVEDAIKGFPLLKKYNTRVDNKTKNRSKNLISLSKILKIEVDLKLELDFKIRVAKIVKRVTDKYNVEHQSYMSKFSFISELPMNYRSSWYGDRQLFEIIKAHLNIKHETSEIT